MGWLCGEEVGSDVGISDFKSMEVTIAYCGQSHNSLY
jgi:hypothetical protein